ncbi:AMP-binding protein [Streptomyces roseus]|uniref:AMP-binding protein n=1 Tax=Streptomyces TaxID=1883 RepID=UPI0007658C94|nr:MULTISPECIES: AMP-binding protein [Streptomyces]
MNGDLDFASLWRRIAADHPERPALIHGTSTVTWQQFDDQAAALAAHLRGQGAGRGDVAALALPNRPEHLVCLAACLRIGLVPANVNYRYRARELEGILTMLAPAAVFLAPEQLPAMVAARTGLPGCRTWIATGPQDLPVWAESLEHILRAGGARSSDEHCFSSPDDTFIKCTGGTTGAPAAIRWRVGDLARNLNAHNPWLRRDSTQTAGPIPVADARLVVASPLMHGSGQTRALGALCAGGTVITVPQPGPSAIWDAVAQHRADTLAIVGDPLARPLATALHRRPGRWDLSRLSTITSSGAAWSQQVKRSLLGALPHVQLIETLGATEATGIGSSVATAAYVPATGTFDLGPNAVVLRSDGAPASVGQNGLLAVATPHPLGLHPSGGLPAERFRVSGGTTYLLSGDHARLTTERRIVLLGRDSECVSIGGEKVYLPEITHVLLKHPDVQDAAVVPLAHPVRGTTLGALLQLKSGAEVEDVRRFAHGQLADFKVPRSVVRVGAIPRSEAGKLDTAAARIRLEQAQRASAPVSEEPTIAPRSPAASSGVWQHLTQVAEREQLLLENALASLFINPALDDQAGKALGYPEWPQPLTLLPVLAPELANATEDLSLLLQASADATAEVVEAVARHGWPRLDRYGPDVVDAVWLLMQHADLAGERRDELLCEATRNATTGLIDGRHLALLDDRIQSLHGQPQRYGTFMLVRDEEPRFIYPLDGPYATVDERRRLIGMPLLHEDLNHAYSPITPYGAGRTTASNRFTPRPGPGRLHTAGARRILASEPVPPGAVPVYLAATLRHRNKTRQLRDSLPAPLHSTSRWLDLDPLTRPSCQFDAGIALNRLAARLCLEDVRRSKVLIAMEFSRRSAGLSVEIGCALAAGIPVIYVGEPSCSFDMLPEVALVPDVDAAIETALTWTDS